MTKWEYFVAAFSSEPHTPELGQPQDDRDWDRVELRGKSVDAALNSLGEDEWELVGVRTAAWRAEFYFKRPRIKRPTPASEWRRSS